ncbi:hypothetical protein [Kushneria phosphatilytica]|uniref:Uncharacterized protein n=1 Tax=Kushneria phosphatilytica TaxID=657387 RepID=A0A1S1NME3_9GAMM|nr:hypothetical protein [Kushneria phosphatilytica]OHV08325.1 hypothetical protein BH688_13435 [Kushneria phosphatilytica]QEL09738.1 hypothetical protein FY550_00415 [Kushneria phosphatilytica]
MIRTRILNEGTLHCFPTGLRDEQGRLVNAEISAAVFDGERLILASDKPIPGESRSAVFAVPMGENGPQEEGLEYFTGDAIKRATKYEDFALTANGRHVLATTGFDRIDEDSHELNAWNHLLIWPLGQPERISVVDPDPRDDVTGSLELRRRLDEAIGLPYYKIEGLAAIPADQGDGLLLFGIREQGQSHEDFDYVSRVVGAHYRVDEQDRLTFIDDIRELLAFDPGAHEGVRHVCGLSSLEYDPYNGRLYLLTSFETEEEGLHAIGGYLWVMTLEDFHARRAPGLVGDDEGAPRIFEHKAEGLAVLDAHRLLVAYDNDREMALGSLEGEREERYTSEAPWTLLSVD